MGDWADALAALLDAESIAHAHVVGLSWGGVLAQVMYAKAYSLAGWAGPVVLAATAIGATFALLAKFVSRYLRESTTLVFVAAALALTVPHLLARPHVLALPVMVAWAGHLIAAADRRTVPSFWLLPLMMLWANLHGGFVFGLVLIGAVAVDAVLGADPASQKSLLARWFAFGVAALAASCITPYGWNALLASQKILALGSALPLIREWKPADFESLGPLEICLLLGIGLALFRGIKLPPMRIVLLLGLHMSLPGPCANPPLLAPIGAAAPLARKAAAPTQQLNAASPPRGALFASVRTRGTIAGRRCIASSRRALAGCQR